MGAAHTLRKALRLPSRPGIAQSRMAQSSVRLFSTGVPVSATRARAGDGAQRPGGGRGGVLDVLRLVGDDQAPRDVAQAGSRGAAPAVVAAHRAVGGQHEPGSVPGSPSSRSSGTAAAVEPADGGAGGEPLDLRLPVAQQARPGRPPGWAAPLRCASSRCRWRAIRVTVLPRPMSSARQAPEAERGQLVQPGQAVPLVVAQRRLQAPAARRPARGSAAASSRSRTRSRLAPTTHLAARRRPPRRCRSARRRPPGRA